MLSRMRELGLEEASAASVAIRNRLGAARIWRDAQVVALYSDLAGEVPTEGLIQAAFEEGRRVVLPRIGAGKSLSFVTHEQGVPRVRGRFGVLEPPPSATPVELHEIDLFVVPGLAFDARGGRLGRGAGYYDRALAAASIEAEREEASGRRPGRANACTVGVAFDRQIVDAVPMGPFDVRLDAVVTDAAAYGLDGTPADPRNESTEQRFE